MTRGEIMKTVRIVDDTDIMIEVRSYNEEEAFVQVSANSERATLTNTVYLNPNQVRALRKALKKAIK